MKSVNLDKFIPPPDGAFPYNPATEAGRYLNRLEVDQWVAHGWCQRMAEAEPDIRPHRVVKNAWKNAEAATCERLAEAGRGLSEPFNRLDLAKAAKIAPEKASNVMSRWRVLGWVVGGHSEGWTRTSGFGEGGA